MSEKYELIDAEKAALTETGEKKYAITAMCEWLDVSTSGYYEWVDRPDSATTRLRGFLALLVMKAFEESDETYGYRRVHAQLLRGGQHATPELVRSLMRELDLVACQPRPWRHNLTESDPCAGPIPDLVHRDVTADTPGETMVGDITCIPTWEGWGHLATVIDCHTKAVIGWAMDDNYKTSLIDKAIRMAARNYALAPGATFHSDRGSNYTSRQFAETLESLTIRQSVGRTGICFEVSRRRESHPPPLAEPCVKVALHTAPTVEPVGLAPCRQWANIPGYADAISASFRRVFPWARRNRLYFRIAHFTRKGLMRCSRKRINLDL